MKWLPILAKFPKWALAGGIIVLSTSLFVGWWMFRGPSQNTPTKSAASQEQPKSIDFKPVDVVLCGNTLANYHTGEILAKQWLEGFGDSSPPIVGTFLEDKLVIVGNRGSAIAFGFDGKAKKPLSFDGKPIGASAFSNEQPEVVFVRDGNLWRGKPDWVNSAVNEAKRITDVGYFRNDVFTGEWLWTGESLYLSILGRPQEVSLTEGTIQPRQLPLGSVIRGLSKNRRLSAFGTSPGQFAVAEFATGVVKAFPTIGEVKQVLWLTEDRVAILGSYRQLSIYDHAKGKVIWDFQAKTQITSVASASPDGKFLLLGTHEEIKFLEVDTGKSTPVSLPIVEGAWTTNDTLLCSNSTADSEIRGIWLLKMDGSKERISNQPTDSSLSRGRSEPIVEVEDGVLLISGGNLWHFQHAEKTFSQVIQGQRLAPNLKILNVSQKL
ncbi:MAG: WD40 repeat domain-containing protein [Luteolibacter sp.]|uniref:WD40 repeat domain-containing protein n=1 Tax=Luteolibacter sp. TaxID=1962973 RepID=UPI003267FC72